MPLLALVVRSIAGPKEAGMLKEVCDVLAIRILRARKCCVLELTSTD